MIVLVPAGAATNAAVLNHPNFTLPNAMVNSGGFGTIASTVDVANGNPLGDGGPRLIQFALKLSF